jgi:hypothetical protein
MAAGRIHHRDTKTIEMIRDGQVTHLLPAAFSVASVPPWWEAILRNKANRKEV